MTRAFAALIALLAALVVAGCGEDTSKGFSEADRALITELESETLAYQAAADRITGRLNDGQLGPRELRTESRQDVDELRAVAARLTEKASRIEHDAFRGLAEPAARFYTDDAGQVDALLDAYAENDAPRIAELSVAAQRTRDDFVKGQTRRLEASREDLPEDDYNRLRAAFAESG